jgi:hypothetical protein
VETGDGRAQYCVMVIRGKDAQETRFRRYLWWQANRDWLGVIVTIGAVGTAFVVLVRTLG